VSSRSYFNVTRRKSWGPNSGSDWIDAEISGSAQPLDTISIVEVYVQYLIAFLGALGLFWAGRFFVMKPSKVYRFFSFGQQPNEYGVSFFKAVGWIWCVGAVLFMLMGFIAILRNFLHSR
jgi:hypothetical protein